MANRRFSRLSRRWRFTLIALALATFTAELSVHNIFAREYYYLNVKSLQLVALTAAKMGAVYLPTYPRAAVRIADAYVQSHGVAPAEIVLTELSPDGNVLTIRLDRKIPEYVALLATGGLPARDIDVTASAWRQRSGHSLDTQILDIPAPNGLGVTRKFASQQD
jgi:hypothetical protein